MNIEPIRQLNDHFLSHSFGPEQAIEEYGTVSERTEKRWTLIPKINGLTSIQLGFEDLKAGKGLLTSVHFQFVSPQNTAIPDLENCFGATARWLPRGPSKRNFHLLILDRAATPDSYQGTAQFEVISRPKVEDEGVVQVTAVHFRRYFPAPLKNNRPD